MDFMEGNIFLGDPNIEGLEVVSEKVEVIPLPLPGHPVST